MKAKAFSLPIRPVSDMIILQNKSINNKGEN